MLGLLPPFGGNVNEAPHDPQEDAGTYNLHTTGELGCSVPGPIEGLSICIDRGD